VPSLESVSLDALIPARKTEVLCAGIVGCRNRSAKQKNSQTGWNGSEMRKTPALIALRGIPVQKWR
jgi:hypothetical protein